MKKVVDIYEAESQFSSLVKEVEAGAGVTISRAGNPVIRMVKFEQESTARKLGFAKGEISDLSDSAWEELDAKFRALFKSQKASSKGR